MHAFEDPWSRFISTGKVEDYLSYRSLYSMRVAPAADGEAAPDLSAGIMLSSKGLKPRPAGNNLS